MLFMGARRLSVKSIQYFIYETPFFSSLRNFVFNSFHAFLFFRYNACLMRQRFEKNKNVKDLRIAKQLVIAGEEEVFRLQHPQPRKFPKSPGGVAYDREVIYPDWLVDYWHPSEKAAYPYYFARREERKKDYLEWYKKQYPDVKEDSADHHWRNNIRVAIVIYID